MAALGNDPTQEAIEEKRKMVLKTYFRFLGREGHKTQGKKPWETVKGPIQQLHEKTRDNITRAIQTPEREIGTAIFRRGIEKLVTEMPEFKSYTRTEKRKLYDTLDIAKLKQELEGVRKSGDNQKIGKKELKIAEKIQGEVCRFRYKRGSNKPSEIIDTGFINCLGSTMLGGGLLGEMGIEYLHVDLPEHSATILITKDGKAHWLDFTPPFGDQDNQEITPNMVEDNVDIAKILPNSLKNCVSVTISLKGGLKSRINLSNPEIGLNYNFLNNKGNALSALGRYGEALEAYERAIELDPEYPYAYNGRGNVFLDLGRKEEALEAFERSIELDPEYSYPYTGLGNTLSALDKNEEAIGAYERAIELDPKYAAPHVELGIILEKIGKKKEAIEEYEKFLELWKGDQNYADRVRNKLKALKT